MISYQYISQSIPDEIQYYTLINSLYSDCFRDSEWSEYYDFTSGIPERGRLRPLFIPISKGLDTVLALGKGLDT